MRELSNCKWQASLGKLFRCDSLFNSMGDHESEVSQVVERIKDEYTNSFRSVRHIPAKNPKRRPSSFTMS
jgi:hypothetical protein